MVACLQPFQNQGLAAEAAADPHAAGLEIAVPVRDEYDLLRTRVEHGVRRDAQT